MRKTLIRVENLSVRRDDLFSLNNISLSVDAGEIVTIVVPNGAGKSTLLKSMMGLIRPDYGQVFRKPGLKTGYLPQTLVIDPVLPLTVRCFLSLGVEASKGTRMALMEEVGVPHLIDRVMDVLWAVNSVGSC